MTRYLLTYAATFIALYASRIPVSLVFLWLGVVAKNLYRESMGQLLAPDVNLAAAAGFYLLYPIGLVVFAVLPSGGDWLRALLLGALFGLFCYGTYDLTNLELRLCHDPPTAGNRRRALSS